MSRPERRRRALTAGSLDELRTLQKQARRLKPPPPPEPVKTSAAGGDAAPTRSLGPEDRALFRRVMQGVHPLSKRPNRALIPPAPVATPDQLEERRRHAAGQPALPAPRVSDEFTAAPQQYDNTAFMQAGHGPQLLQKLRQRKWPVGASLDLHGATLDEARQRLDRFVQSCREHDMRCVRVVHGKGHGSAGNAPVLKDTVRRWLSQLEAVQAWVECEERDGGAGAVLVLLDINDAAALP